MTERPSQSDEADSPQSADWEVLARHMAGEDTPDSRARAQELLSEPGRIELFAALDSITKTMSAEIPSDIDVEAALRRVKARMKDADVPVLKVRATGPSFWRAQTTAWRIPYPALAAAGLIVVGLGSWLSLGRTTSPEPVAAFLPRMIATGVGTRDSVRLSDGTRIVLGPQSSVKVDAAYGTTNREVEVRGDAYFDVVHNAATPFTVHIGNATIQDVGTRFAVRSDAAEGIGVTVTEGSVSLAPLQSASSPVVLKAGDHGTLDRSGKVVARRGVVTDDDVAWVRGRLVFRETPLTEVISSMRRWYGIELKIEDPSLANRHLTATFSGEPADRVLEVLSLALGANVERRGDTAVVRSTRGRAR